VFRRRRASTTPLAVRDGRADPRGLGSPPELVSCRPGRTSDLLSWDSSRRSRASRIAPERRDERRNRPSTDPSPPSPRGCPHGSVRRRWLPPSVHSHRIAAASVHGASGSVNPVPSSWFHTTSTASSARRSRACCIPLPVLGFAAFPGGLPRGSHPALSRDAFHTPRRNPRRQPHHVTVAVAPWPFASGPSARPLTAVASSELRSSVPERRRLRGFAPPSSWDLPPTVASRKPAPSFPGLGSPSRSFRSSAGSRTVDRGVARPHESEEKRGSFAELRSAPAVFRTAAGAGEGGRGGASA